MNRNNTSGFKGVSWNKVAKKWETRIKVDKKYLFLGYFLNKKDAFKTYRKAVKEYHKEFACF